MLNWNIIATAAPGRERDLLQELNAQQHIRLAARLWKLAQSISWLPNTYPKHGMVWEVRFARKDCTPCVHRAPCTKAKQEPRLSGLQAREPYEALQAARQQQTTDAFRRQYAARAGIEGTHEQAIRRCGVRRSRHIGQAKTHLPHVITATAINVVRVGAWLGGTPRAKTRLSAFAALAA